MTLKPGQIYKFEYTQLLRHYMVVKVDKQNVMTYYCLQDGRTMSHFIGLALNQKWELVTDV